MENDYYGNGQKWFVGVVEDTMDPKNSNRVRVRIKGIHPDEGGSTGSGSSSTTPGSSSSTTPSSSTPSTPGASASGAGIIEPDRDSLPAPNQFSGKLSENFTLGQLVVGAENRRAAERGMLTKEHVYNLAKLAKNCLEPLLKLGTVHITSGWRITKGPGHSPTNHPGGFAADFQIPGHNPEQIGAWVKANMAGKFTKLEIATRHNHIQIGGGGSTSAPIIFRGKSY